MRTSDSCQRCSQLPPPPSPPAFLSVEGRCPSYLFSSSTIAEKKMSNLSLAMAVLLGTIVTLLLISSIVLIKHRRRRSGQTKSNETRNVNSPSVDFHGHSKFLPLLSDSCSSDQMSSAPTSDIDHQYEQIVDEPRRDFSLVYCRSCTTYHPTSCRRNLYQSYYLPLPTLPPCSCHR